MGIRSKLIASQIVVRQKKKDIYNLKFILRLKLLNNEKALICLTATSFFDGKNLAYFM